MANRLRFRSGQVQLHRLRVASATVIEAGDLVYLDGNAVKPASDFPWDSDLATTQAGFAAAFVGVAHQPSAAGETHDVSVDTSPFAIYEFDVDPGTFEVGDGLGPDAADSTLMNQQLAAATSGVNAIARAAEYRAVSSSLLRVAFASSIHTGSANANAVIG